MKNFRHLVLGIGVASILFVLLFPPLRSSSRSYAEPQLVDQKFVAWHLSRFRWRPGAAATNPDGTVVRTEVDGGELLRELALIVVLFGTARLWLPVFVDRARLESAQIKSETPKP